MTRPDGRAKDEMRPVKLTTGFTMYAEGSVLAEMGNTRVICTASVEEKVPPFLEGKGLGWVTAEYAMLPRSTNTRKKRDIKSLKLDGRSSEIQRLIGRALRAVVDREALGERQITIDCDVIQADSGTRCASITGAEDSHAIVDCNVVMTSKGEFIEVQGTGEGRPFTRNELDQLLALGEQGCSRLCEIQKSVLGE